MAAVSRWISRAAQDLRRLRADERLALMGVMVIVGSLVLPWFGAPLEGDLVQTGFGGFGWAEAALLLTAAATLGLLARIGDGWVPPRPLREWGLLATAGGWAIVILVFRMIDRPSFDLAIIDVHQDYGLRYGIFVALGGAVLILVAGLRVRSRELRAAAAIS
jgi:hypothetical protein